MEPKARVFLGIPTNLGRITDETLIAVVRCSNENNLAMMKSSTFPAAIHNFNLLYAAALNARKTSGVTHFAMIHDDISPEANWLDKMVDIMIKHEADILSVISPIKDNRGLTSTAFETERHFRPRRLTMHEVMKKYEPTFTHPRLLVNNGLMLVDIRKPWAEQLYFKCDDEIRVTEQGEFQAYFASEDWNFSRMALKLGAKLFATREVKIQHEGRYRFRNDTEWGTLKEDV